jgi:hypothetical protein
VSNPGGSSCELKVSSPHLLCVHSHAHSTERRYSEPSQHIVGPGSVNYHSSGVSRGVAQDVKVAGAAVNATAAQAKSSTHASVTSAQKSQKSNVFVAGILAVDYACDHQPRSDAASSLEMHTSNPARIVQSLGGVGHNVARATSLMGGDVRFCSAVGDDLSGKAAMQALSTEKLSNTAVKVLPAESGRRTAQYISVNEQNKDLTIAMADMSILNLPEAGKEDIIAQAFDDCWLPQLEESRPTHVVIDANWPLQYLARWFEAAKSVDAHVTFEPVSNACIARSQAERDTICIPSLVDPSFDAEQLRTLSYAQRRSFTWFL